MAINAEKDSARDAANTRHHQPQHRLLRRHRRRDGIAPPRAKTSREVARMRALAENHRRPYKDGKRFYLVGSKQEVIEATVAKLKQEFAGIDIVGYRNGYIKTEEERKALIDDIAARRPDVVFVAMGSPKQELLMEEMSERHPAIYQGLGGSFDVYTDYVKRAPQWWVRHNLEFAYRLIKQPSRIKRQIHLVRFWLLVKLGRI